MRSGCFARPSEFGRGEPDRSARLRSCAHGRRPLLDFGCSRSYSFVDYPLRTGAIMTVAAFACGLLIPPQSGSGDPQTASIRMPPEFRLFKSNEQIIRRFNYRRKGRRISRACPENQALRECGHVSFGRPIKNGQKVGERRTVPLSRNLLPRATRKDKIQAQKASRKRLLMLVAMTGERSPRAARNRCGDRRASSSCQPQTCRP